MAQNLHQPALADTSQRVKLTREPEQLKLEGLTEKMTSFFDILMEKVKEKSQTFLKKPPGQWVSDPVFKTFYELAAHTTVVNDVAESLNENYNNKEQGIETVYSSIGCKRLQEFPNSIKDISVVDYH